MTDFIKTIFNAAMPLLIVYRIILASFGTQMMNQIVYISAVIISLLQRIYAHALKAVIFTYEGNFSLDEHNYKGAVAFTKWLNFYRIFCLKK